MADLHCSHLPQPPCNRPSVLVQLYPAKAAMNLTGQVWELSSLPIYRSLNAFGQFLFLHLRDTTTGCFFLDFSDSPSQVFICVFFLLPPQVCGSLPRPDGHSPRSLPTLTARPHPPSWLQWPVSKQVTPIHSVSPDSLPCLPDTSTWMAYQPLDLVTSKPELTCSPPYWLFFLSLPYPSWSLIPWFWQFFPNTLGMS